MSRKLLTLDQLIQYCEKSHMYSFNSKDTGYELAVQVPGNLTFENESNDSILYTTVKVCHTLKNRNSSYISEENMKKALPTLKYKPLLASIIEIENGELDFNSHDMEFIEDEDGNLITNYIEKQVGTFTVDEPYLEYDKQMQKTYVIANAAIPTEYTPTAEIIKRKKGTKVSCELSISNMAYNAKEKYLEIIDFEFSGVTLLGEHIEEGMLGSRLDISDFSVANNSIKFEQDTKLVEVLEKLNTTLSSLNINKFSEEGGKSEVENEELLTEEVTEEVTLTEEEEAVATEEITTEEENNVTETEENSEEATEETPDVESITMSEEKLVRSFELSHDDVRYALYVLLQPYEEADNDWYYIQNVYDNHFVYSGWSGNLFGQKYEKDGDNINFVDERYVLYADYVTESEKLALEEMRNNYSLISDKLAKYEAEPEKIKVLESDEYSSIADKIEFASLKEKDNHFDLSIDEIKTKADEIILSYAKKGELSFSEDKPIVGRKNFSKTNNSTKRSRYGGLGKKKEN